MNQDDSQHAFHQVRVRGECCPHKVIDSSDRFDSSKTTPGDNKGQQRLFHLTAIAIRLFQVGNQMVAQSHGIAQRLHGECVLQESWNAVEIRDTPQAQNEEIEIERVAMMIKAMGNNDSPLLDIYVVDLPCEEADTPQHLASRVYNRCEIEIAGRYLVKHG